MSDLPSGTANNSLSRRQLLRRGLLLPSGLLLAAASADRLGLFGSNSAATGGPLVSAAAAQELQSCVVSPQVTEGPYFVDERLQRSDIRTDPVTGDVSPGVPLRLGVTVLMASGGACAPLPNAQVDVWHCDAAGVYSDVRDPIMGAAGVGRKFLRGYQVTDDTGRVEFMTIYPGWYQGRAVHIHFKIRTDAGAANGYDFTSQFFFDDALNDEVFTTRDPYAQKGRSPFPNARDGIYRETNGVMNLSPVMEGDGYAASMNVILDPSIPAPRNGPGGPGSFPGGPGFPGPGRSGR